VLFSKEVHDPAVWEDARVDLSAFAGQRLRIVFETSSRTEGAVGMWANPLITARSRAKRPNVLIYMIDTLRADHTSLHKYSRRTTPFLQQLGSEAIVFEDCHAQASWTKPSVASLLTSLYSFAHGLQEITDKVPPGAATLAESLRKAGYVTASIITNPFPGRNSGLERGFDYLLEYPVIQRKRTPADQGTDSGALNRVLMPWIEQHRDEPFFLYAHATDPHAPYDPPDEFESRFADLQESGEFQRDYGKLRQEGRGFGGGAVFNRERAREKGVDPERWVKQAVDRYDAETAHNDNSIEQLIEKLRELGILEQTLVIVLSDHGEEFLEHGWTTHGHALYQEQTHVLWLMWNPKLLPAPRRITDPVQLIDVMPTLLDQLGIPAPSVVQGTSRVALIRGESVPAGPVFSSRRSEIGTPPPNPLPESWTDTVARLDGEWKFIYRPRGADFGLKQRELYQRKNDPNDRRDVAEQHSDLTEKLTSEVREWIAAQEELRALLGTGGQSELDAATLERLRSLGYVGGGKQP
jgi:arylsulfatase A-like enzyme